MIGRILGGRYQVLDKLGEGSMGEVYLVMHLGLARKEALKVLHPRLGATPELISRFRREARAANRLQHPNIISVYDFGQLDDGRFYLTAEFAEGESLDARLQRIGRFPPAEAMRLLAQLADAVDHAHGQGVVHRDLKPANIYLVERRGQREVMKVLDFGLAKIIAPDYKDSLGATDPSDIFGTPAYMAPEQVRGAAADPRMDIYAAGCIAFELVVGETPFTGNWVQVMHAHVDRLPPTPSARGADIPAELEELILGCLEKDPNRRPQTGRAILAVLRDVPGFPSESGSSGRRSSRAIPRMRAALAADPSFEEVETEDGFPTAVQRIIAGEDADALVATSLPGGGDLRATLHAVLRALAEALIDRGSRDFQLTIGAAEIANVEGRLERIEAELDELARQSDAIDQRSRDYEASLRFAIGELRFECEQADHRGERVDPRAEQELSRLDGLLHQAAAESRSALDVLSDRGIALAAEKADREDDLVSAYAGLDRLVREIAARFAEDPTIVSLLDRLARLRRRMSDLSATRVPGR